MLFSSLVFAQFFAVYMLAHILLPSRFRLWLIIVGSAIFYGYWNPYHAWIPFVLTAIAWVGGGIIDDAREGRPRATALAASIVCVTTPLLIYKYAYFIYADVIGLFVETGNLITQGALPLGISFITFTLISYLVDVYYQRFPRERSFKDLAAYVLFFPQLIAGPILRPRQLLPQLHAQDIRDSFREHLRWVFKARFLLGAFIFSVGIIKKVVFADSLAEVVDRIYESSTLLSGFDYLLGTYAFSVQIYCDFSGYTDMAIGLAMMLRVRLPTNFLRPYTARSIAEFWRLWHITLSNWLRDYIYIPLGGNRGRQARNLITTMGIGGLWHGASWNYVIWGLMHGVAIAFTHFCRKHSLTNWVPGWLGILLTFHFVTFTFIIFRAPDWPTAMFIFEAIGTASYVDGMAFIQNNIYFLLLMVIFLLLHRYDKHSYFRLIVRKTPRWVIGFAVAWMIGLSIVLSHGSSAKFIYFDF